MHKSSFLCRSHSRFIYILLLFCLHSSLKPGTKMVLQFSVQNSSVNNKPHFGRLNSMEEKILLIIAIILRIVVSRARRMQYYYFSPQFPSAMSVPFWLCFLQILKWLHFIHMNVHGKCIYYCLHWKWHIVYGMANYLTQQGNRITKTPCKKSSREANKQRKQNLTIELHIYVLFVIVWWVK